MAKGQKSVTLRENTYLRAKETAAQLGYKKTSAFVADLIQKTIVKTKKTQVENAAKNAAELLKTGKRFCPKDDTAMRWKEGVGAYVCARGHILGIDVQPEELKE